MAKRSVARSQDPRPYRPAEEPCALQGLGRLLAKKFTREVEGVASTSTTDVKRTLKVWADLLVMLYGPRDGRRAYVTCLGYASLHGTVIARPARTKRTAT